MPFKPNRGRAFCAAIHNTSINKCDHADATTPSQTNNLLHGDTPIMMLSPLSITATIKQHRPFMMPMPFIHKIQQIQALPLHNLWLRTLYPGTYNVTLVLRWEGMLVY